MAAGAGWIAAQPAHAASFLPINSPGERIIELSKNEMPRKRHGHLALVLCFGRGQGLLGVVDREDLAFDVAWMMGGDDHGPQSRIEDPHGGSRRAV